MLKKSLISLSMSLVFAVNAHAYEQVNAQDLVGKGYGGLHYSYMSVDEDRVISENLITSELDDANGFGFDLGYRLSTFNELRLRYTDLDVEAKNDSFSDQDGSILGIDLLHFPTEQNVYFVAGLKDVDLDTKDLSVNAGMGYRHYFTKRLAAYAEAKALYQFDDSAKDFNTSIGLMYFFGGDNSSTPVVSNKAATPKPVEAKRQMKDAKDSDKDGVIDRLDKCPTTPQGNKVDAKGCTVFTNESATMELQINFDNNKAEIKSSYLAEVERAVAFMNQYKHVSLVIEGHTSAQGSAQYNKTLSAKRANAVVDLMVNKYNIDASRLSAVGYGEERLLNTNNTAQAHAENRRIQAKVSASKKVAVKK